MSKAPLTDSRDRDQALDITDSFIVQAPAGSGKTELLIMRFLKLLCVCEQPEQVLAITFTKKAANEMGRRIIAALRWAEDIDKGGALPTDAFALQRLEVARQVLAHDRELGWHLLDYPSRLRVQTIDSFCAYLAGQLPILSRLGGSANISEDIKPCFVDAISRTLALLETEAEISADIALLLAHLDNDLTAVENLLVDLLYKRDQWLPHLLQVRAQQGSSEAQLQASLIELIEESLEETGTLLSAWESQLIPLVNFAALNMQAPALSDAPLTGLPDATPDALPQWHFIADLLLTQKDEWRKTVNVKNGFPADAKTDKGQLAEFKARKEAMVALLAEFATLPDLLRSVAYLRLLPSPDREATQWQFLGAVTRILIQLCTQLLLSFRQFRMIDYTQTSAAARTALGSTDAPTDLALALDHRIQHVLVDEFQDTSQMQLDILELITAGWENGDGRTLFLVGDAMQSCYGFRNANVGIYLNVRARGLGAIALTPLTLETNFRSQHNVVSWVNDIFSEAFPAQENISRGAVPYTPSVALHPAIDTLGVRAHIISYDDSTQSQARQQEAEQVVARIQALQRVAPEDSIAVLVRARGHLQAIVPLLRDAGIHWQATDIDHLATLPVIEDLITLTRALVNKADRLSWLALLRAPWCGLTLADLHAISCHADSASIWSALQQPELITALSDDGRARVKSLLPVLDFGLGLRQRGTLRHCVEQCWRLLGGIHTTSTPVELDSVAEYFTLLASHEHAGGLGDIDEFCEQVAAAFVPGHTPSIESDRQPIHLLTMHKAKGLEYDHVILPGLSLPPKSDTKPLLQWHARLNHCGEPNLFLATLSAAGSDDDPLYKLLRHEQKQKALLENTRLLYIAITRARTSVSLFATLGTTADGELKAPVESSLLSRIWPQLLERLTPAQVTAATNGSAMSTLPAYPEHTPIRRFAEPLRLEQAQLDQLTELRERQSAPLVMEAPVSEPEASIGTLIHRSLEALCSTGTPALDAPRLASLQAYWRLQLRDLIDDPALLESSVETVTQAVTRTLNDADTRWLFAATHTENESELALSRRRAGVTYHYKIDRSFVDAEGVRWIIDYKTGLPSQSEAEQAFIDTQCERYAAQLETYRALLAELESRPIRTALFFTALGRLVELRTD